MDMNMIGTVRYIIKYASVGVEQWRTESNSLVLSIAYKKGFLAFAHGYRYIELLPRHG